MSLTFFFLFDIIMSLTFLLPSPASRNFRTSPTGINMSPNCRRLHCDLALDVDAPITVFPLNFCVE